MTLSEHHRKMEQGRRSKDIEKWLRGEDVEKREVKTITKAKDLIDEKPSSTKRIFMKANEME